jgi:hypothetical protein
MKMREQEQGKFTQIEIENQRRMAEETRRNNEENNRKSERNLDKVEKEKDKEIAKDEALIAAGSKIPEGGQFLAAAGAVKEKWDQHRAQKKEENIADKRAKNEKDIMKKQKDMMDKQYKGQRSKEDIYGAVVLLFIIAMVAHIYDWMSGFQRPPNIIELSLWLLIIIMHFFFISERHFDGDQNTLFGVVALTVILPVIINMLMATVQNDFVLKLAVVLITFPPLVLYLMFKFPAGALIGKWYLFLWVILLTVILITSPAAQDAAGTAKEQFSQSQAKLSMGSFAKTAQTSVNNLITNLGETFDRAVRKGTGQEYEGDEESRVGIFLEDVRPVETQYYTTSQVYLQGTIRAQNIKDTVIIKTRCYIPDTNFSGVTYPATINMINNDENYIDCKFPGRFAPGSFEVKMVAQFIFTTEAKINYYFIDASRRPDSYTKTKIPQKSVAIYTGGPVILGLPSLNQPLRISLDVNNKEVGDYPFGISLKNKWTEGKVVRGINYTLDVPDSVNLYTCNRQPKVANPTPRDGRKVYVFNINNTNLLESFDSVTCRMRVTNPAVVLGKDIERAPEITFRGTATYEYAVEQVTYVNVVSDGMQEY